ncbi:MAG: hypothetical protein IPI59_08720 [Sphingobacteriales bacterium]|nr:hypothetical protein [Sphingobacteriales bacterium]MBP9141889.1 hypothetical protein [Chitinophagales bacterium]MDA0198819.1 hypothetical protein [Bacteroidota bacterium]MBK6889865.1 hypothetical protein [Sphingobacteriales bacterium]MBK7527616.1 hypothetical protein [Sphingobacteriales bacterium]
MFIEKPYRIKGSTPTGSYKTPLQPVLQTFEPLGFFSAHIYKNYPPAAP